MEYIEYLKNLFFESEQIILTKKEVITEKQINDFIEEVKIEIRNEENIKKLEERYENLLQDLDVIIDINKDDHDSDKDDDDKNNNDGCLPIAV